MIHRSHRRGPTRTPRRMLWAGIRDNKPYQPER
jgi:hypothetical protein